LRSGKLNAAHGGPILFRNYTEIGEKGTGHSILCTNDLQKIPSQNEGKNGEKKKRGKTSRRPLLCLGPHVTQKFWDEEKLREKRKKGDLPSEKIVHQDGEKHFYGEQSRQRAREKIRKKKAEGLSRLPLKTWSPFPGKERSSFPKETKAPARIKYSEKRARMAQTWWRRTKGRGV